MHDVVKIEWTKEDCADIDERTEFDKADANFWHLVVNECGSDMTFCGGQVYTFGDTAGVFKTKTVKRGGITCKNCLDKIKRIKAVRL